MPGERRQPGCMASTSPTFLNRCGARIRGAWASRSAAIRPRAKRREERLSARADHELLVRPRDLFRQLRLLQRWGYRPAGAAEVLSGRGRLLHVTFDDTFRSGCAHTCSQKQRIEAELGRACSLLAYPYGDQDRRIHEAARRAGYPGRLRSTRAPPGV